MRSHSRLSAESARRSTDALTIAPRLAGHGRLRPLSPGKLLASIAGQLFQHVGRCVRGRFVDRFCVYMVGVGRSGGGLAGRLE